MAASVKCLDRGYDRRALLDIIGRQRQSLEANWQWHKVSCQSFISSLESEGEIVADSEPASTPAADSRGPATI